MECLSGYIDTLLVNMWLFPASSFGHLRLWCAVLRLPQVVRMGHPSSRPKLQDCWPTHQEWGDVNMQKMVMRTGKPCELGVT